MAGQIGTAEDPFGRSNKRDVAEILHYGEESVSVALEEIKSSDWVDKVYRPDIKNKWDSLYKRPGYDESDL